jgi:hypothetical protein
MLAVDLFFRSGGLRSILSCALAVACLLLVPKTRADSLTDTLNKSCGAALSNLDCSDVATGWPVALGGVIGALELVKGQMSGADDCEMKLSGGSSIVAQASKYINIPGVPVSEIRQCSCKIVYSTATCSGEVNKVIDSLGSIAKDFFGALGIGDYHQPPDDHDRDKADYYSAHYEPLADKLVNASHDDFVTSMRAVTQDCVDDWDAVQWVSDALHEVCGEFYKTLMAEIDARHKFVVDQVAAEQDAWQKKQDAVTDNARKIAMNWANIKRDTYVKQCRDDACRNDITALAFFYYGDIATGMQNQANSNTQVLIAANAKFEPLFKEKVAASVVRETTLLKNDERRRTKLVSVNAPRMRLYRTAMDQARSRLEALGVRDPKQFLVNAYATRYAVLHASRGGRSTGRVPSGDDARPVRPGIQVRPWGLAPRQPEVVKSTLCRFTDGPRRGQVQDYAPMAPLPVGSGCQDARGSSGVVIAP